MNGHFETGGIYPLSTVPAEGYGSDPLSRSGKVILSHVNGKHVKFENDGFSLIDDREDASKFADHSAASIAAANLIEKIKAKHGDAISTNSSNVPA